MCNCTSFKFYEQFGLINITEPNTIKLFIPYILLIINITKKKNKQTGKPNCKKSVIDQASGQDSCTLKLQ